MQLNPKALAYTVAIFSAACWFILMTFSLITGIGNLTMTELGAYHPFFTYSWGGMIIIVIEHLVGGYIVGWIFAWLYNKFLQ